MNGAEVLQEPAPDGLSWVKAKAFPHSNDGFHMGDTFTAVQIARGWRHRFGTSCDAVIDKPLPRGWRLELRFQLGGKSRSMISNRYALVPPGPDARLDQPDWEWADINGPILEVASRGVLRAFDLSKNDAWSESRVISDLSDMTFEAIAAPYVGVGTRREAP